VKAQRRKKKKKGGKKRKKSWFGEGEGIYIPQDFLIGKIYCPLPIVLLIRSSY
jgi:hypothetical protein